MFRSVLMKITAISAKQKGFLKPMQLPSITSSNFKNSCSNQNVDDWISSLPEDKKKRVKLIQTEIVIKNAEMKKMPELEMLTKADYEKLFEMSANNRFRYYFHIYTSHRDDSLQDMKKLIREKTLEEKKQLGLLDPPISDHIEYGLGKNTQFYGVRQNHIVKWRNMKLWRAIKLNETPLIIDCDFSKQMSDNEIRDLARQIKFSFSENRLHRKPFVLHLCNMNFNSMLWYELSRQMVNFEKLPLRISKSDITDVFPVEKLVYLSPNSPNLLEKFNSDDCYVVGGIVGKQNSRDSPFSLSKSKKLGIRSARLPLKENIKINAQQALTLDQMTRIMLELRHTENWHQALKCVPSRKIVGYTNHTLLPLTKPTEKSTDEQPKFRLRRQNLPPYPHIDCVGELKVDNYLPSSFKVVKYGDYEFLEKFDGYVCMFINGYHHSRQLDAKSGYSVFFGINHPLNLQGSVKRRQGLNHARLYAFLKGMEQIPKNLFTKLCIMVDDKRFITFIDKSLRNLSQNAFRSVNTGKLNIDLETSMEVNRVLRLRQDLTLQLMYCPNDILSDGMYYSLKMAQKAGEKATLDARIKCN